MQRNGPEPKRLLTRLSAREREQCSNQAAETSRLPVDHRQEAVTIGWILLRAELKRLHGVGDRREGGPELVSGVGDELPLRPLPSLSGRDVGEDQESEGRAVPRRDAREAVGVFRVGSEPSLGDPDAMIEETPGQVSELDPRPGLGKRRSFGQRRGGENPARRPVRERDVEPGVDGDHALLQLLEQRAQSIALGLQSGKRLPQATPHPIDGRRETTDLVAEETDADLGVESPRLDRRGRRGDPAQSRCDQDGDEQTDHSADKHGQRRRAQDLGVQDPSLRDQVLAEGDGDERRCTR